MATKKTEVKPEVKKAAFPKYGDKSNEVKMLQKMLRKDGSKVQVDGVFGCGTRSAVQGFQRRHKISVTGVVNAKTWNALSKLK